MDKNPDLQAISEQKYHFFKKKGFGLLVVCFLLLRLFSLILLPNNHYTLASDLTPNNILNAVNKERSLRNLVILNTNDKLGAAAQSKADDMIARKYFAHVDPDGHYIWDKIVAQGYSPYSELGENLAVEFYDTDSLMSAWMNSPTHRANILQEGFRDQGMGLSFGDVQQGQYYSSIANTFGTLAVTKVNNPIPTQPIKTTKPVAVKSPIVENKSAIPSPAPIKNSAVATTTSNTNATTTTQKQSPTPPVERTEPTPATITQPLAVRGDETSQTPVQSNFALPADNNTTSTPAIIQSPTPSFTPAESASTVVGNKSTTEITNYDINRYLILIAGVFLLLLLGTDIKKAIETKIGSLDKKVNNLALLVIAMVVVAFIYWL